MEQFISILKELGVILGGISSIWKTYKEVIKPYLTKRRKQKLLNKRKKL